MRIKFIMKVTVTQGLINSYLKQGKITVFFIFVKVKLLIVLLKQKLKLYKNYI